MDRVVMEIVETEGVYVRDLQQVIEVSEKKNATRQASEHLTYDMKHFCLLIFLPSCRV
jgi:hypothetical protein